MMEFPLKAADFYTYEAEIEGQLLSFVFQWNSLAGAPSLRIERGGGGVYGSTLLYGNRRLFVDNGLLKGGDLVLLLRDSSHREDFFSDSEDFAKSTSLFYLSQREWEEIDG